jgi:hypothetical protein
MKFCAKCKQTVEDTHQACPHCADTPLSSFCPGDRVRTLPTGHLCTAYHDLPGVVEGVEANLVGQRLRANNYDPTTRRNGNLVFVRFTGAEFAKRYNRDNMTDGLRLEEGWIVKA